MATLLPVLLAIHVALAVSLFAPSIALPFALRGRTPATQSRNRLVRSLLWLQAHGSIWLGIGLALTGALLVLALGTTVIAEPWLLVALIVYGVNLALAFFLQRPNLRRLVGIGGAGDPGWVQLARRQRYVSYLMAGLVGTIGLLMSAKPALW